MTRRPEADPLALHSPWRARLFFATLERRLVRAVAAVRVVGDADRLAAMIHGRPLVVYCNHPSWWDVALLAAVVARLAPARRLFAPFDADALGHYGFLARCGAFGVEPASPRGARRLLDVGARVLADPGSVLCVTPQGRFADPRQRPVQLQRGLAALLARTPGAVAVPVALEYPFWSESRPEALVRLGEPVCIGTAHGAAHGAAQGPATGTAHDAATGTTHDSAPGAAHGAATGVAHDMATGPVHGTAHRPVAGMAPDTATGMAHDMATRPVQGTVPRPAAGMAPDTATGMPHDMATGPVQGTAHRPAAGTAHDTAHDAAHGPAPNDVEACQIRLTRALTDAMDALAADALSRDPGRFETLLAGRAGVGGVYDAWRRTRAALAGRRFDSRHASITRRPAGEEGGATVPGAQPARRPS